MGRLMTSFRLKHPGLLNRRMPAILLWCIIGLACLLRMVALDRHFFWFDEGLLFDNNVLSQHRNPLGFAAAISRDDL